MELGKTGAGATQPATTVSSRRMIGGSVAVVGFVVLLLAAYFTLPAGEFDVVTVVSSSTIEKLNRTIEEIRVINGVVKTNTVIVLRTV